MKIFSGVLISWRNKWSVFQILWHFVTNGYRVITIFYVYIYEIRLCVVLRKLDNSFYWLLKQYDEPNFKVRESNCRIPSIGKISWSINKDMLFHDVLHEWRSMFLRHISVENVDTSRVISFYLVNYKCKFVNVPGNHEWTGHYTYSFKFIHEK